MARIRRGGSGVWFCMDSEKPAPVGRHPEGCLAVAIRIPVRIVVFVLVVPVRMVWDLLVVAGRVLNDVVLRPLGRALVWVLRAVFVWPLVGLWRYVVVPLGKGLVLLGRVLLALPLVWAYRNVLTPLGHGLALLYARVLTPVGQALLWALTGLGAGAHAVLAWLARYLLAVPAVWLYAWVLAPVGRAVAWTVRGLATGTGFVLYWLARIALVLPVIALWRWVLAPVGRVLLVVGREVGAALGHAWRVAGHLSLVVGRCLATLFRWIFVEPVRWVYRTVLTPVGHVVRDLVLRPAARAARAAGRATGHALGAARESVRQARADIRRLLLGAPRTPEAVDRREPTAARTRTLERSTTALTKD